MTASARRRGERTATAAALAVVAAAFLAACAPPPIADGYLAPAPGVSWQMVLTGNAPPDDTAAVYDLDASATAAELAALRAANPSIYLVCYVSIGTWESWRDDAGAFPAPLLGKALPEWEGERYVDVREIDTLGPIWQARLDECAAKGFDAVDPDNIDVYANDSGFPIAQDDVVTMMAWLANEAHARGLAIGQKNAPELVADLAPLLDFAVVEECLEQDDCDAYGPYVASGKPVFAVEYPGDAVIPEGYCDRAALAGLSLLVSPRALDGPGVRCA
ncbi:MAG: endo alpha-1,4 polygalactosaminidase [Demequinaceae bacterium]|nr:endo alpha-1,4 polygalactosaminidase [Demequinaceae bacterium]